MRVILVRHGSTEWLENHLMHGSLDIPLSDLGFNQATEAAVALSATPIDVIFTSPLSRCRKTAEIIGDEHGITPIDIDGFIEQDFGWLEGRSGLNYRRKNPGKIKGFYLALMYKIILLVSAEPNRKFKRRVISAWESIQKGNSQKSVLLVAHRLVFKVILDHCFRNNRQNQAEPFSFSNASITEIELDDQGNLTLVRLNDTEHLSVFYD